MAEDNVRKNKTKEEIAKDMEVNYETTRQRKWVKDIFYPWLLKNSKSVEDAKNLCYATNVAIEQTFHVRVGAEQTKLSEGPLKDLHLENDIKGDEKFNRERELIEMLKDEPVATASSLLKGMKLAIESFEREDATKRTLDTLPATLLD